MAKRKDLVDKEHMFLWELARYGSIQRAERAAGYSQGYGTRKLDQPGIREKLAEIAKQVGVVKPLEDGDAVITAKEILTEAAYLATSDVTAVLACQSMDDIRALPERVRRAIKKVRIRQKTLVGEDGSVQIVESAIDVEMHEKNRTLALLAMHAGIGKEIDETKKKKETFTGLKIIRRGDEDGGD